MCGRVALVGHQQVKINNKEFVFCALISRNSGTKLFADEEVTLLGANSAGKCTE